MNVTPWSPRAIDRRASGANRPLTAGVGTPARRLVLASVAGVTLGIAAAFVDTDLDAFGLVPGAVIIVGTTTAAVAAGVSRAEWLRAIAYLFAGTIGTAAGAGLAPAQLVATGLSTTVLVGTISLAGGIALLVLGLAALLRAMPGIRRLLAIPAAFLVAQLGVLPLTMAVVGTHPAHPPFAAATPEGVERVSLPAADGVMLAGWYTPTRNGAAVVLLHGAGGDKTDTRSHASALAGGGYGVLALDARGAGESGGHGMLWGWHGAGDVASAVAWLATQPGVDGTRIGAVGLSMGGEEAITAAAFDPRIAAVVAEGASARVPGDKALPGDLSGLIEGAYYPIMWGAADLMTAAPPPVPLTEAVRALGTRHLLLISSDDPNDRAAGPRIRDAAPGSVELWEPLDTGHTLALATHREEWIRRVLAFLGANL